MIALLAALMAPGQAGPPAIAPPTVATPPADWSGLPALIYVRPWANSPDLSRYVRSEVAAGRCVATDATLRVDVAVLVAAGGQLRRIVPRAIDCPTVEQYASGLVLRLARGNVVSPAAETWYQTTMIFTLR